MEYPIQSILRVEREPVPEWLMAHKKGDPLDWDKVFGSRTVFYPGSFIDGDIIKYLNREHLAHTFVYVDYMMRRETLEDDIATSGLWGYTAYDSIEVREEDLFPMSWTPHFSLSSEERQYLTRHSDCLYVPSRAYRVMKIFERKPDFPGRHRADRLAVLFLYEDGCAAYDALFASHRYPAPFLMVVKDHGMGMNYTHFGYGGHLEEIARRSGVYPRFIYLGPFTVSWPYTRRLSTSFFVHAPTCHNDLIRRNMDSEDHYPFPFHMV